MKDTSDEIYKIQHDIFMQKPLKERFMLNLELTEFMREMTRIRIIKKHPEYNEKQIKSAVFREIYHDIFSEEEFREITKNF